MDILAETVLLWTYVGGLVPRRWQVALGRQELLPYLLPKGNDSLPQQLCPETGWVSPADGERLSTCSPGSNRHGTGRESGWILQD